MTTPLTTERMLLRRFSDTDRDWLAELHGDPAVMRYIDGRLFPAVWGRGYATEGARALVRRAFTELGLRTFYAQWPTYIEGAEHGDVEYALSRQAWQASYQPSSRSRSSLMPK